MRRIFGRSVVANSNLEVGHLIEISDLVYKKPGGGLSWRDIGTLINRRVVRPVLRDDLITEANISEATK
jgi:sialic acid synthase SpsE